MLLNKSSARAKKKIVIDIIYLFFIYFQPILVTKNIYSYKLALETCVYTNTSNKFQPYLNWLNMISIRLKDV